MGNSASQQRPATVQRRPREPLSTTSADPHASLRTKKKSLELPDLASLTAPPTRGRPLHSIPPKSASIPIPPGPIIELSIPGEAGRTRAPVTLPSNTDVHVLVPHNEHRQVFPPASRNSRRQQQRQQPQHIQELYNQSQAPLSSGRSSDFEQEVVYSTIPLALPKETDDPEALLAIESPPELFQVKITWRGGGRSVYLARASDDNWNGRLAMTQDSPGSAIYNATVYLPRGTHHIRFLIDDLWRVADDLPTAVDDQGSLANYVTAPAGDSSSLPSSPPPSASNTSKLKQEPSFWSAMSSTDDDPSGSTAPHDQSRTAQGSGTARHHEPAVWTSVIPQELVDAAQEEEAYLASSEGQATNESGTQRVQGFVPAPLIPSAPGLPRHLGKLILNPTKTTVPGGHSTSSPAGSSSGRRGNHDSNSNAHNQGREREREWDRDREGENERERERTRDRDRGEREDRERRRDRERRGNPPPPPPPSEAGTADLEPSPPQNLAPISTTENPSVSPVVSTPASPVLGDAEPTSATITSPNSQSGLHDVGASATAAPSSASTPGGSTAASTATTTPMASVPTLNLPPLPANRPLTLSLETSTPALMDDASVLSVPSHAVLHHLSTSAIKNGVLAVGNTTRYRKKYLTTIYYKPT